MYEYVVDYVKTDEQKALELQKGPKGSNCSFSQFKKKHVPQIEINKVVGENNYQSLMILEAQTVKSAF